MPLIYRYSLFIVIALTLTLDCSASDSTIQSSLNSSSSILDNFYLNYFGIYHGASMNHLASPRELDNRGNPSKFMINFDSEITAAYLFSPEIGIGPDIPFLLVPVVGQGAILGDVGIKAFDRKTLTTNNFTLYTNLIIQAPTSKASQAHNMTFAIKTTPYFLYHFPQTRFTMGVWSEAKTYLGVTSDKSFKLYAAPYLSYRIHPTFSVNLEYEYETHHNVGTSFSDFTGYQSDFQPGVVWNVSPHITFNPYLQVFTNSRISLDRTALGAIFNATLL